MKSLRGGSGIRNRPALCRTGVRARLRQLIRDFVRLQRVRRAGAGESMTGAQHHTAAAASHGANLRPVPDGTLLKIMGESMYRNHPLTQRLLRDRVRNETEVFNGSLKCV